MNQPTNSTLLLATLNRGKLREFQDMLSLIPVQLRNLMDFPNLVEVEEVGHSFRENAILKAKGYAEQTGLITLADDSGLEVQALGGAPGVLSARYAGEQASDAARIDKLLTELSLTRDAERRARFVCVIAIFDSTTKKLVTFEGTCAGRIAHEPLGTHGFGYDPIFIPDGYTESFGSLSCSIKDKISHRGVALTAASAYLGEIITRLA
jgi:XTP/dITP diphosphohydrolase